MDIGLQSMPAGRKDVAQHRSDAVKSGVSTIGRNVRQRTELSEMASYKDQSSRLQKWFASSDLRELLALPRRTSDAGQIKEMSDVQNQRRPIGGH